MTWLIFGESNYLIVLNILCFLFLNMLCCASKFWSYIILACLIRWTLGIPALQSLLIYKKPNRLEIPAFDFWMISRILRDKFFPFCSGLSRALSPLPYKLNASSNLKKSIDLMSCLNVYIYIFPGVTLCLYLKLHQPTWYYNHAQLLNF